MSKWTDKIIHNRGDNITHVILNNNHHGNVIKTNPITPRRFDLTQTHLAKIKMVYTHKICKCYHFVLFHVQSNLTCNVLHERKKKQ